MRIIIMRRFESPRSVARNWENDFRTLIIVLVRS